ncbi:DUF2897 family protein [Photobacterium sp. CCB-ST2H9]|uniref:DUF2897 family protein n=1 Tax=Photobacterium sp. CCB-ST2H9 TaxID=2912855 RepID=UPI002004BF62|nr:DUF2897 family protein [Photobacterium sp. CCB-ST2H9]UTM58033.1 DUF2897 family protein [Photobacterium sp. CCB-ST2H9]
MDWLLNPWVITIIIVSVVVSNIAAIKYTANMKFGHHDKTSELLKKQQEVENLTHKGHPAENEEKK